MIKQRLEPYLSIITWSTNQAQPVTCHRRDQRLAEVHVNTQSIDLHILVYNVHYLLLLQFFSPYFFFVDLGAAEYFDDLFDNGLRIISVFCRENYFHVLDCVECTLLILVLKSRIINFPFCIALIIPIIFKLLLLLFLIFRS